MTALEMLLLVPLALQFGTVVTVYALQRAAEAAGDEQRLMLGRTLWRRHLAVTFVFFAAAATALVWRVTDAFVLAFAALFVIAEGADAALTARHGAGPLNALALRASLVALAGLVAMLALDILPGDGGIDPDPRGPR